jgi:hypothetical protein
MKTSSLLLSLIAVVTSLACGHQRPLREELVIPAVDATRLSAAPLPEVDERKSPPKWLDHEREDGDDLFGVGVVKGRGNRDVDLYRVQEAAEAAVADWLRGRGMQATAPRGLAEPLDVDLRAIFIEEIAHNRRSETEADYLKDRWEEANDRLASARKGLKADAPEGRLVAGLAVLFDLDRRAQYEAQYLTLTGKDLDPGRKLRDHTLEPDARAVLAAYGVRIATSGAPAPGLYEAVEGTLQRLSLQPAADGAGAIEVRVDRRDTDADGRPFVYLDGELRVRLEGPTGPARVTPLRVKGSGSDPVEAEAEADRRLADTVRDTLIATLRAIAER